MKGETATVDLTPSLQQDTIAYMQITVSHPNRLGQPFKSGGGAHEEVMT